MNANLILSNGNIHTMDPQQAHASAIALQGDRILAVGTDEEVRSVAHSDARVIDLESRTVLPGFIDAHIHLLSYGLALSEIDLVGVDSVESALEQVRSRAERTPSGQWLTGRGWDQSLWNGGGFPSAADLDQVTREHPVFLRRKCGHVGWANRIALERAGIGSATPDPAGGEIERDEAGRPTGILFETAMNLVNRLLAEPSPIEAGRALETACSRLHEMGIVGVHTLEGSVAFQALQRLRQANALHLRVLAQLPLADLDAGIQIGLRSGFGDEWIRIGGVKIFSDGALGPRTAWMIEPYEGEPENRGIAVTDADALNEIVERAARAGLAVFVHAIGDGANRAVLDAIARSREMGIGHHLRHRIEHAQILHPDDLARFADLNVIASMQPIHATQDMVLAERHWGDRVRTSYAWRSLLSRGARLAFGSDAPVETPDVLSGIYAAVSRRRADGSPGPEGWVPEERLSVEEAVHAYTLGAAYAGGDEQSRGSLTAGKLADLTILSRDIFAIPPSEILDTEVLETMVGGRLVFSKVRPVA